MTNTKEATRITIDLSEIMDSYTENQYNVILHNDDWTPFEYVILVMTSIFNKDTEDAIATTIIAHENGKSIVGTYDHDKAVALVDQVALMNQMSGMELKMTIESL